MTIDIEKIKRGLASKGITDFPNMFLALFTMFLHPEDRKYIKKRHKEAEQKQVTFYHYFTYISQDALERIMAITEKYNSTLRIYPEGMTCCVEMKMNRQETL